MIAFFQHLQAGKMLETALFEMPEALGMLLRIAWRLWNASSCGRGVLLRACSELALPGAAAGLITAHCESKQMSASPQRLESSGWKPDNKLFGTLTLLYLKCVLKKEGSRSAPVS